MGQAFSRRDNLIPRFNYHEDVDMFQAYSIKSPRLIVSVDRNTHLAVKYLMNQRQKLLSHVHLFFPECEWGVDEENEKNQFIHQLFFCLITCKNLNLLFLAGPGLTSCPIYQMQVLRNNLSTLILHHLKDSVSNDLIYIFEAPFSNLSTLDFRYSECVTNNLLENVFETCMNLKQLIVIGCSPLSAQGFSTIGKLKFLSVFHLDGFGIKGTHVLKYISQCKSLKILRIFKSSNISSNRVKRCVLQLPLLQRLVIESLVRHR